jgi:hypothetical protein
VNETTALEPAGDMPGAYLVHVPFERVPHGLGAVHHIDSGILRESMSLTDQQSYSLSFEKHEYNTYLLVIPPTTSTAVRYLAVTSGTFRAVLFDPSQHGASGYATDIKPTIDLVVPAGLALGLQVLVANRASFLVASIGKPVIKDLSSQESRCAPHWSGAGANRAIDATTGEVLSPP